MRRELLLIATIAFIPGCDKAPTLSEADE